MPGERIAVIEDDREITKLLRYNLEQDGYTVLYAGDGEAGLALVRKSRPDLVILDLMLPKMSGLEVCKIVRAESAVPIIILTAKREETDRVLGLELGADDYVTKPFSVREMMARVKTVLRRAKKPALNPEISHIGKLEVDWTKYEAKLSGKVVPFTSKEFELLKVLFQSGGKALSREDLLRQLWNYEESMEIDTRTVDQHVARLRSKLGPESERLLTVKNVGYRLKLDH